MTKTQETKIKKLGIFTLSQAQKLGLSQQNLSKLVKQTKIKRVSRGIYVHPEAKLSREVEFQIACSKLGPKAVIGGLSALFYYNLAEEEKSHTR